MNIAYRLVLKSGSNAEQVFLLDSPELIIGRDPANQISIPDPEVSRRHARLFTQGVNYILEDLGSTNGTAVNGQRLVGPYILQPGEIITLGENTHLLFEQYVVDPDATRAMVRPVMSDYQPRVATPTIRPEYDYVPQPVEPGYADQIPPLGSDEVNKKGKLKPVIIILIILVILLLCGCIGFAIFDFLNLYCDIPSITNLFIPGACPP